MHSRLSFCKLLQNFSVVLIISIVLFQVHHQKQQVLVHFNGWGKRFDTVFPMNSNYLRGPSEADKKAGMKVQLVFNYIDFD